MAKIICCFLFLLSSVEASVWEGKNSWDESWEREYAEWLETEVTPEFFTTGRWRGVKTDCADAVYFFRAIFSYLNEIEFVVNHPNRRGRVISSNMNNFDRYSNDNDRRVRKFLNYIGGVLSTRSLKNDTYSPELNPNVIFGGGAYLIKGHVYQIASIDDIGIPYLLSSTVPRKVRTLKTSWEIPYISRKLLMAPYGGFRNWRFKEDLKKSNARLKDEGKFSMEQYTLFNQLNGDDFQYSLILQDKLSNGSRESSEEKIKRLITNIITDVKERAVVVLDGYRYFRRVGRRLNSSEYDQYSTPSRDKRLHKKLDYLYNYCYFATERGLMDDRSCVSLLRGVSIPVYGDVSVNLKDLMDALNPVSGNASSNPHHTLRSRWGL